MLKPAPELAERLWLMTETDRKRPAVLLHVTILPVGDTRTLTDAQMTACRAALEQVHVPPFPLAFDRIEGGDRFVLTGWRSAAVHRLQDAIQTALDPILPLPSYGFHPHMTLNYRAGGDGRLLPDPVGWRVEEFLLIESIYGETRHVEHGRWRLG